MHIQVELIIPNIHISKRYKGGFTSFNFLEGSSSRYLVIKEILEANIEGLYSASDNLTHEAQAKLFQPIAVCIGKMLRPEIAFNPTQLSMGDVALTHPLKKYNAKYAVYYTNDVQAEFEVAPPDPAISRYKALNKENANPICYVRIIS